MTTTELAREVQNMMVAQQRSENHPTAENATEAMLRRKIVRELCEEILALN